MRFQIGLGPLLSLLVGACTLSALWVQRPEIRAVTAGAIVFVLATHVLLAWLWNWTPRGDTEQRAIARLAIVRRVGEATAVLAGVALLSAFVLPTSMALAVVWVAPSLIAMGACAAAASTRWSARTGGRDLR